MKRDKRKRRGIHVQLIFTDARGTKDKKRGRINNIKVIEIKVTVY